MYSNEQSADFIDNACTTTVQYTDLAVSKITEQVQVNDVRKNTLYCVDCDRLIPAKRKEAYPNAIRCVDCQSAYEETEKTR